MEPNKFPVLGKGGGRKIQTHTFCFFSGSARLSGRDKQ